MKEYKCMGCLTSFESEYKEDCPSCGDDSDVIEVSAHTDKLSVEKLQEQLNTAKYFFKNILDVNPNLHGGNSIMHLKNCVNVMKNSAEKALAAIGGDDE